MKQLIYIMGSARSGTTLLDLILGNSARVFSAGELNRFPKRGGIPPGRHASDEKALFWNKIKTGIGEQVNLREVDMLTEKYEYHKGIFQLFRRTQTPRYRRYQKFLRSFFYTLFQNVEEEYIIDSSKYPLRAYHLSGTIEEFRYCIYIKKDPVDVMNSFQKKGVEQPSKHWFLVNLYLIWVHFLARLVTGKLKKRGIKIVTVNYNDLVERPCETIDHIQQSLNINFSAVKQLIIQEGAFSTGNLFDGNRIRLKDSIRLERQQQYIGKRGLKDHIIYFSNWFWWKEKIYGS